MERVFRQTMGGIQKVVQSPRSNSEAWVRSGLSGEEPSVEKLFDTTVVYTMIQLRDLFETENWYKETTPLMFWELEFTINCFPSPNVDQSFTTGSLQVFNSLSKNVNAVLSFAFYWFTVIFWSWDCSCLLAFFPIEVLLALLFDFDWNFRFQTGKL